MKKILMAGLFIIITAVGLFFTACGYSKKDVVVTASYTGMEKGYLSLVVGQQARVEFTVTKLPKNSSANLIFSKNSNSITTPILESYNESTGKSVVTFTALAKGEEIYLRAIADGGNYYELNIKVSLPITDFTLKSDVTLFAVRGTTNPKILQLDSSIFNFYPSDTSQKDIIFQDSNGNEITQINANDYPSVNQIAIRAISPHISKFNDLTITLINEIGEVNTFEKGVSQDTQLIGEEQATSENPQTDIVFITNRSDLSRKTIRVIVPNNTNSLLRVNRSVISQSYLQCSDFDISKTYQEDGSTIFEFELQSLQAGSTTIRFDVYYLGYESYKITRTLEAIIESAPDQIRMNDISQDDNVTQILFDGAYSTVYSTQYLSIIPTTATYDRIEVDYDLEELGDTNAVMSEYIRFTVGGNAIGNEITNLTSPIIAKGIKATNEKTIYLVIRVFWGEKYAIEHEEEYIEYVLGFEVKTGASALRIKGEFDNINGIYLENNGEEKTFNGLYVENTQSYTDNLTIYPISQGAGLYAKVEALSNQPTDENGKIIPIKITPLSTGTGKWRIFLPNGVYRDLTINVITQVNSLKLDFNEYTSSLTGSRIYDENNSLTKLGVKLKKDGSNYVAYVQLKFTVNPSNYNLTNTKLCDFGVYPASEITDTTLNFDNSTNILSISTNINGFSEKAFDYRLVVKKVRNFQLITESDLTPNTPAYQDFQTNNIFSGSLNIEAYVPLTKVNFTQNDVSLYSNSQLGLNYKELSMASIGLVYTPNDLTSLFADILPVVQSGKIKIELSSSKSYTMSGNTIIIENYGSYDFETGLLTVDVQANTYDIFYIYARVTYYNEIYTASLKVTPKFYQTVNEVYLSNNLPTETETKEPYIYLSPTHSYQDIFTYVSPENAVHKDLRYTFEPDLGYSGSLVRIESTNNNGVRIIYNNNYSLINNGGSGTLYISPLASITETSSYPDNSLIIKVKIGAGTPNNPFIISTAEELINIGVSGYDKDYVLTNIIDLSNVNFTSLGAFSGTIDGEGVGKIIGLNITKQIENTEKTKTYSGLFTQILANGTIKNLVIEGSINLTAEKTGSIGLVAGEMEQGSTLQNVTVLLNQSTITIKTSAVLRIGGVVGVNQGTIINYVGGTYDIDRNGKNTTYKYTNYPSIVMNGKFTISYALESNPQTQSYLGGIAGVNESGGIIERTTVTNVKVYNNDNYTAVVNMLVEGAKSISTSAEQLNFSIGAIAGKNASKITASRLNELENLDSLNYYDYLKASGNIEIVQASNKLGGLVGENLGSSAVTENAVSRVKLRSSGTGKTTAFLGGLFAYNQQGTIQNCLLQALEDGVSLGTAVSMIYSDSFGLTTGEDPILNGKVNIFGYDSVSFAVQDKTGNFAFANHLKCQTYVGAALVNGVLPEGKRAMVNRTTFATFYNYYGDFLVVNQGVMFDEVDATLISNLKNTTNRMQSEQNSVNMSYLQYYKTLDTTLQEYVADKNIYDFPFDFNGEVNLYSFDQNIISIGIDGKLTVRSTGLVKIRVLSSLNAKISQDVYIYVVKAANNFSLYIQNVSEENEISAGRVVEVYSNKTVPLIAQFYMEIEKIGGKYIEYELAQEYILHNLQVYEEGFVKTIELIKIGSLYGLEAINGSGNTQFNIYANIQLSYNGENYVSSNLKTISDSDADAHYMFNVEHINGATAIMANVDEIAIEPIDVFSFNVLTYTDKFDEELITSQTRLINTDIISGNYFNIEETNRIYTIKMSNEFPSVYYESIFNGALTLQITQYNLTDAVDSSITLNLLFDKDNNLIKIADGEFANTLALNMQNYFTIISTNDYQYEFKIKLEEIDDETFVNNMLIGTSINSYIKLVSMQNFYVANFTNYSSLNYNGVYYINFNPTSIQENMSTVTVNIAKQSVGEITVESFSGSTQDDINLGNEQSNYIDPQAKNPNHMRILVFPSYSDYDYITINNETTSVTSLFTLINVSGQYISGSILITNGIKILKENILNNYLYVKYACNSTGVVNGQVLTYSIKAYKNEQVIYTTYKYLTVKFTKDVTFEIVDRKVENESTTIYLTRGSTYNFTIQSNGYLENEIYMTTTRTDIISINKSARTIQVLTNFTYQDVTKVSLSIQGRKVVSGENISSAAYTLEQVIIVDYYIMPNDGFSVINSNGNVEIPTDKYTPIKNGSNGIVSVGLGNSYNIATEFLRGLTVEYSPSVSGISSSLETFQNLLNKLKGNQINLKWEYKLGFLDSEGNYTYPINSNWTTISGSVAKTATNDYFTITETASGYLFTPLKVTNVSNPAYIFKFTFGYDYLNGLAIMSSDQNVKSYEFVFNVYQLSSIDTPTPIYTAEEFSAMNAGAYYILMDNITLPSSFKPITNAILGLDGNGKKIIISNNLAVDSTTTKIGIFSVIETDSLVRNLTIEIANTTRYTINQTTQSSIYVGLLAGENKGIITNVSVLTVSGASFRVAFATELVNLTNYVGGLVGLNSGYITNSRAIISLTSSANMSGFVGYNTGKISTCYVDKSLIINTSSESQNKTAGFVVYNSTSSASGGKIINSYVSGLHTGTLTIPIYANDTSTVIRSSTEVAGFIYENNGEIINCYSDIPIQTSSKSAGFVYLNKGKISSSYSTSQLKVNSQESYGFVYDNSTGTLKNNYFLKDNDVNYSINTNYDSIDENQLKHLTKVEFTSSSNFENFLFTNSTEFKKGIWFMPILSYESQFNNSNKTFVVGKPELVGANLITKSQFIIDIERTIKDEVTGEITYYYTNSSTYAQGNIYNPYLISNALEFENTIKNSNSGNLNTNNFRIIADIDYEELVITSSKLFNTVIIGDIEGNGMEIRGYIIDSSTSISSGGLFSKIGNGTSNQGTVKNLTLKPKYINMPNATAVGGLAGTLDSGILFNITINGFEYSNDGIVILGRNIVGGVIGRAIGSYVMINIESSISTNATYRSPYVLGEASAENKITSYFLFRSHVVNTLNKLSYSGSVVAVAAGKGQITNVTVSGRIASMGEFASLVFGGVGDGVVIKNVSLTIIQGQFVQVAVYGGLVSGEFYGQMSNAVVSGANEVTNLFKTVPFEPYAVGGLVGLMGSSNNLVASFESKLGGRIENSKVSVVIKSTQIKIVGGLVGELIGGRNLASATNVTNQDDFITSIKSCSFVGSLQSEEVVGGIIGKVSYTPSASISYGTTTLGQGFMTDNSAKGYTLVDGTSVTGGTLSIVNENNGYAYAGGIVGMISLAIESKAILKVNNSYSTNKIKITSDIYGSNFGIFAGGLVGGLEKKGQEEDSQNSSLEVKNSYFASSIVLSLRDLKQKPENSYSNVSYGKIVANSISNFTISGENIFYKQNSTVYTGAISESSINDYLLLKYYENGTMKEYNDSDPMVIMKLFNKTTIESDNANNEERVLPSLASGYGFDLINIWIIKVAGQLPVLRFE